jgi:hypothetical protein
MELYGRKGYQRRIPESYNQNTILTCSFTNVELAKGRLTNSGFCLLKGSRISPTYDGKSNFGLKGVIEELLIKGLLLGDELPSYYILKEDISLHSPSAAARLVHGNDRNGYSDWSCGAKTLSQLLKANEADEKEI